METQRVRRERTNEGRVVNSRWSSLGVVLGHYRRESVHYAKDVF